MIKLILSAVAGVVVPVLVGYTLVLANQQWRTWLAKALHWTTMLLIVTLGIAFGLEPTMQASLVRIGVDGLLYFGILTVCNLVGLWLLSLCRGNQTLLDHNGGLAKNSGWPTLMSRVLRVIETLQVLIALVLGYALGRLLLSASSFVTIEAVHLWSFGLLGLLLMLIGVELRDKNVDLKLAFFNTTGIAIASCVIISSWFAACIIASIGSLQFYEAIAITSGFGWYSLSGLLVSQTAHPSLAGLVFSLDLAREILVIFALPILAQLSGALAANTQKSSSIAVGYSGATAMDVALPFLQKAYGVSIVPAAISSGLILSIISPVILLVLLE